MEWFIKQSKKNKTYQSNIFEEASISEPQFYIDGFIIPRVDIFSKYSDFQDVALLKKLYKDFGDQFIHHIKGAFILVLRFNDKLRIYTDRHSIKKVFIYSDSEGILLSNSLKYISEHYTLTLDKEKTALFSIFSHNLPEETIFQNVSTSLPAGDIKLVDGKLSNKSYWHPSNLVLNRKKEKCRISEFAEFWQTLVEKYIVFFKPNSIDITLTGGNDSRMVLAALLSLNAVNSSFSFGNPLSGDGVIAKKLTKKVNVKYNNFFVNAPTSKWFLDTGKQIIKYGNSLINIHRAHRHDAIEKASVNSDSDKMLFTGLVGGEYMKETFYNNNSIPSILEKWFLKDSSEKKKILLEEFKSKGLKAENIKLNKIVDKINQFVQNGNGFSNRERKFIYTYLFYGCTHHTQDSNVFGAHYKYVVSPFMDIDFLDRVSRTNYWHLNTKQNIFKKLFHSRSIVGVTVKLYPQLGDILYAKRGAYTPNDLVYHPLKYLLKRVKDFVKKDKMVYPLNFPMGKWLEDFSLIQIQNLPDNLKEIFDIEDLIDKLQEIKNKKTEASWHCITNPINVKLNYEYYC